MILVIQYCIASSVSHEQTGEEFGCVTGLVVVRASTIVMIRVPFAVWLNNQANIRAKNLETNKTQVASHTVVVAK